MGLKSNTNFCPEMVKQAVIYNPLLVLASAPECLLVISRPDWL